MAIKNHENVKWFTFPIFAAMVLQLTSLPTLMYITIPYMLEPGTMPKVAGALVFVGIIVGALLSGLIFFLINIRSKMPAIIFLVLVILNLVFTLVGAGCSGFATSTEVIHHPAPETSTKATTNTTALATNATAPTTTDPYSDTFETGISRAAASQVIAMLPCLLLLIVSAGSMGLFIAKDHKKAQQAKSAMNPPGQSPNGVNPMATPTDQNNQNGQNNLASPEMMDDGQGMDSDGSAMQQIQQGGMPPPGQQIQPAGNRMQQQGIVPGQQTQPLQPMQKGVPQGQQMRQGQQMQPGVNNQMMQQQGVQQGQQMRQGQQMQPRVNNQMQQQGMRPVSVGMQPGGNNQMMRNGQAPVQGRGPMPSPGGQNQIMPSPCPPPEVRSTGEEYTAQQSSSGVQTTQIESNYSMGMQTMGNSFQNGRQRDDRDRSRSDRRDRSRGRDRRDDRGRDRSRSERSGGRERSRDRRNRSEYDRRDGDRRERRSGTNRERSRSSDRRDERSRGDRSPRRDRSRGSRHDDRSSGRHRDRSDRSRRSYGRDRSQRRSRRD